MKKVGIILILLWMNVASAQQVHQCAKSKQKAFLSSSLRKNNLSSNQSQLIEQYDVGFHHLSLSVERNSISLSGKVRTVARSRVAALDTFLFQLHSNFTVDSVLGSNQTLYNFIKQGDVTIVLLPQSVGLNQTLDLTIYYRGTAPSGASAAIGNGFSTRASPTHGNQITWSLSQPYSAYEWWPCKQSLQDKIDSIFVSVTTDTSNKVGSHGLLKQIEPKPNGKHTFHWQSFYPINYYLVMVTVGQYTEYRQYAKPKGYADSILIQNYIYNKPAAYTNNATSILATKPQLELFSDLFGLYPFHKEKYGHVMAPFSGGMEHQTMSSMGIFNFGIVAHEVAHQWFGDNVTCATWSDIWLNEGFASYSEYLARKYLLPATAAQEIADMHSFAKQEPGAVYVVDTANVNRLFSSALTYNKGASALRVLHYLLGDSLFFNVCKTYQSRFANGNASTQDFNDLVNELSGKNYDYYFSQWIYGNGYPVYNGRWNFKEGKFYLKITQSNAQTGGLFTLPIEITLKRASGDTQLVVNVNTAETLLELPLTEEVSSIVFDPNVWILKNSTLTKDATLSLAKVESLAAMRIFPNPGEGMVWFEPSLSCTSQVEVIDLSGRICMKLNGAERIDLTQLQSGIYILRVLDAKQGEQKFKYQKY
jgi:aminopeptidase N